MDNPPERGVHHAGRIVRCGPVFLLEATMTAKTTVVLAVLLAMACGGCSWSSGHRTVAPQVTAMPLTAANIGRVRLAVAQAKAAAPRATDRDAIVRYARQVYVASWAGQWSAAATTETAMAKARAGDPMAREYLTVVVYDLPLQTAMEGISLSAEDWRDIYVGSGIMDDAVFATYAARRRGGKILP